MTVKDQISDSLPLPQQPTSSEFFKQAKELSVKLPTNDKGKVNIYINDCIAITPGLQNNCDRINVAIQLAIRTPFRPLDNQEHYSTQRHYCNEEVHCRRKNRRNKNCTWLDDKHKRLDSFTTSRQTEEMDRRLEIANHQTTSKSKNNYTHL
jgi:hypothetical protein